MNLAQNVYLDDFKVVYIFLPSDFLKFFRLGQFLSNDWSYRVLFGTERPIDLVKGQLVVTFRGIWMHFHKIRGTI